MKLGEGDVGWCGVCGNPPYHVIIIIIIIIIINKKGKSLSKM